MNLPELITKLLLIERQLTEEGIEVNTVKVTIPQHDSEIGNYTATVTDISIYDNELELNAY